MKKIFAGLALLCGAVLCFGQEFVDVNSLPGDADAGVAAIDAAAEVVAGVSAGGVEDAADVAFEVSDDGAAGDVSAGGAEEIAVGVSAGEAAEVTVTAVGYSDDDLFGGSYSYSDDDLFGGSYSSSYSDDALFGGSYSSSYSYSYSDDDLFGGSYSSSYSDDDLFGGSYSYSDDDLFGGSYSDDALFGGDDSMFFDDGIEEWVPPAQSSSGASKGLLFEEGSIKIGGRFTSSMGTSSLLVSGSDTRDFWTRLGETTLSPSLTAQLSLDARPSQGLRMFLKGNMGISASNGSISTSDFSIDEMFTDFSIADRYFFRFGLHTVSWGTGYFYSPVSDIINTSSINPEDTSAQVSGSVNLRTQITFPGTQNCVWLYLVPPNSAAGVSSNLSDEQMAAIMNSFNNIDATTGRPGDPPVDPGEDATEEEKQNYQNELDEYNTKLESWRQDVLDQLVDAVGDSQEIAGDNPTDGSASEIYLKHMGLAGKAELVFGGWEFGIGGFYRYESAPKMMVTFTGSVFNGKVAVYGESLLQYGSSSEWSSQDKEKGKSLIFQFTAGGLYMWKKPSITIAAQYYYDGNDDDAAHKYVTYGHNLACLVSFGNVFEIPDVTATLFGMVNFGKKDLAEALKENGYEGDTSSFEGLIPQATVYMSASYSPYSSLSFTAGPYISFPDFKSVPSVSFRLTVSLGGGKF